MDEPSLTPPSPQSPPSDQSTATSRVNYQKCPSLDVEIDDSTGLENPEAALCSLQQTGSVQDYDDKFQNIVDQIEESLPPKFLLKVYINGLNEKLRCLVRIAQPKNLHEAYLLASEYEEEIVYRKPQKSMLMGVNGLLGKSYVYVMICNVTHFNFIQPYVVNENGKCCKVVEEDMVVEGDQRVRVKKCPNLGLKWGRHEFREEFYVRGMWGCDIMLGRQWLQRLKEVRVMNNGKMEYVCDGVKNRMEWKVVVNAEDILSTITSIVSHFV